MAGTQSISDFKITVKLDTSAAGKSLTELKMKLERFAKQLNSNVNVLREVKAKLTEIAAKTEKVVSKTEKWKNSLRGVKNLASRVNQGFGRIWSSASGISSFIAKWVFGLTAAATLVGAMIVKMSKAGAKIQSANIAMKAAVGITLSAEGKSPEQMLKEQMRNSRFAENLAVDFGFDLADTTASFAKFFTAAAPQIGKDTTRNFFSSFSKLATIFGLDQEKVKRSMVAFQQMADKGQVMAEELKQQLAEQLPGAMIIFARAATKLGKFGLVDPGKLMKLMEKGLLKSKELLPLVGQEMDSLVRNSGALTEALASLTVMYGKLETAFNVFEAGATNQFAKELSTLLDKIRAVLLGQGFQTAIGHTIRDLIKSLTDGLAPLFTFFSEYEKAWKEATNPEKKKLLENFWSGVGVAIKEVIGGAMTSALNSLSKTDFQPFIDLLAEIVAGVGSKLVEMAFDTKPETVISNSVNLTQKRLDDNAKMNAMYLNMKVVLEGVGQFADNPNPVAPLLNDYNYRKTIADSVHDRLMSDLGAITGTPWNF